MLNGTYLMNVYFSNRRKYNTYIILSWLNDQYNYPHIILKRTDFLLTNKAFFTVAHIISHVFELHYLSSYARN
jgi:hypothetical protein